MTTNLTALYGFGTTTSSSGLWKSQTFTASGIWTKPANTKMVRVIMCGGGGGGSATGLYVTNTGGTGGDTVFYAETPIVAKGGKGGYCQLDGYSLIMRGGHGGGSEFDSFVFPASKRLNIGSLTSPIDIEMITYLGNGGHYEENSVYNKSFPTRSGISKGTSITGGGGATTDSYRRLNLYDVNGGPVSGFGSGGIGISRDGAGGGGSFGDGMSANNPSSGGYGGGGSSAVSSGLFVYAGGGGGEVVVREVPVTNSIIITIGAGGLGVGGPNTYNGKSGICIVFWQE